jgi:ribosome-binding protein aMBF1 (putative translation factor)
VDSQALDVSLHKRRRARRMEDPEYRAAYDQAAREIAQTDAVIQVLDTLRIELGVSKAELARRVNRNASSVRRLFTASQVRPELPLIVALADALGAELRVVPRSPQARRAAGELRRQRRVAINA